jgi:hypothetical protein
MTSKPFVKRTLATLRKAELGFFGVVVYTRVQTPRFCGLFCRAGDLLFTRSVVRGLRISWLMVGIGLSQQKYGNNKTPFAARGRDSLD